MAKAIMEIRPARTSDVQRISEIYGRSVIEEIASFELEPPSADEMLGRMNGLVNAGYSYLVACENGTVIGYAYTSPYRPRPAYSSTVENTVYVDPLAWRRGVASSLLRELIGASREAGFQQMIGVIACEPNIDTNLHSSIQLHVKHGFELAGRLRSVGRKHGLWLDTVLMQKTL